MFLPQVSTNHAANVNSTVSGVPGTLARSKVMYNSYNQSHALISVATLLNLAESVIGVSTYLVGHSISEAVVQLSSFSKESV